ncbi:hypothetical protein GCM10027440_16850 [Nocardiopsis coralliicola]
MLLDGAPEVGGLVEHAHQAVDGHQGQALLRVAEDEQPRTGSPSLPLLGLFDALVTGVPGAEEREPLVSAARAPRTAPSLVAQRSCSGGTVRKNAALVVVRPPGP